MNTTPETVSVRKKTVYICGPITGYNFHERLNEFTKWENALTHGGYQPINPLNPPAQVKKHSALKTLKPNLDPRLVWHAWMAALTPAIINCDYILYLEGWEESLGCQIEHVYAQKFDIPPFPLWYDDGAAPAWTPAHA